MPAAIKKINYLFLLGCTSLFCSCIRAFIPDVKRYDELLVVDGNINDGPGPYTVKLSKSSKTQELSKFDPYTNCKVQIVDDAGAKVTLMEKAPGVYQTDSTAIQGIPGRSYKLTVGTAEGSWYESTPEVMPKAVKIESVYGEIQHKTDPKLFHGKDGLQFYVDAAAPIPKENYLFWRMQCTYQFRTDFGIESYYDNGKIYPVFYGDSLRQCYRTLDVLDLFLMDASSLQDAQLKRIPLNYEDNYTRALTIRYSLNVSQFTMSKGAYEYWSAVKKIRDTGGDLYTQQPFQVANNLNNMTDPTKPALGYFMVTGLSEKRIFIGAPPIVFRYDTCGPIGTPAYQAAIRLKDRPEIWPIFFVLHPRTGLIYIPDQECIDCRKTGTQVRPVFWKD